MNTIGMVCALATFLNIWMGHVFVRWAEQRFNNIFTPVALCICAGLGFITGALLSHGMTISAVLGITGLVFLWDGFEFMRQEKRVIKGHAPANPANPRHQRLLRQHAMASPVHWLALQPIGRPFTEGEKQTIREKEL